MDLHFAPMGPASLCTASVYASDPSYDDDFRQSDVSSNALFDAQRQDEGFANHYSASDLIQSDRTITATHSFLFESPPLSLSHAWPDPDIDFCNTRCEWNLGELQVPSLLGGTASSDAPTNTLFHQENDTSLMEWKKTFGINPDPGCSPWYFPDDLSMAGLGAQFSGYNGVGDLSLTFSDPCGFFPNFVTEYPRCSNPIFSYVSDSDEPKELVERTYRCNWPQCSSRGGFTSVEEQKNHTKIHAEEVRSEWSAGKKCSWFQCNSRASHNSRKLFEAHVNNIHVNPLICTVENCKHKLPFRAKHDLQRHISTAHQFDAKYNCPFALCSNQGRRFMRKDKWLSHLKKHHETESCPYYHCYHGPDNSSISRWSVSKHIGKGHSFYECGLNSCQDKSSQFSEIHLLEHIQVHHALEWEAVLKAKDTMMSYGSFIMRQEYIYQDKVADCKVCSQDGSLQ